MTQWGQWKPTHEGSISLNILWNFCLDQCKQWTVLNSKRPCLEHTEELWVCTRAVHFFSFVIALPMWFCQADLWWSIISVHVRLESSWYKFHKPNYLYRSCISTSSNEDWLGQLGYNELLWSKLFCTDKYRKNSFSSILYSCLQIHLHCIILDLLERWKHH